MIMKRLLSLIIIACILALPALAEAGGADYEQGQACFDSGDYAGALTHYLSAARVGNADAENALGDMYCIGLGVERDLETALEYYNAAAEHGSAEAQWMIDALIDGRSLDD